jgi:hypothetical protein
VEVTGDIVTLLVDALWLDEGASSNRSAIGDAISRLLQDMARRKISSNA